MEWTKEDKNPSERKGILIKRRAGMLRDDDRNKEAMGNKRRE